MTAPDERAAALRSLRGEQFVPPEAWATAANRVCDGATAPVSPDAAEDEADALRSEVEAFAAGYWSRPPADRRARWLALSARCAAEPLAGRLRRLGGGLSVEAAPHPDPKVDEIAGLVRELYVLPPRTRAVRRAGWLADRAAVGFEWVAAAKRFKALDPVTAALDPDLLDRLAPTIATLAPVPAESDARRQVREADVILRLRTQGERTGRDGPPTVPSWAVYALIGVVIAVIRAAIPSGSTATPTTRTPMPMSFFEPKHSWQPEALMPPAAAGEWPGGRPPFNPPAGPTLKPFTPAQIAAFDRYDPASGDPEPRGYKLYRQLRDSNSPLLPRATEPDFGPPFPVPPRE